MSIIDEQFPSLFMENAKIHQNVETNEIFHCSLNRADIDNNTNKFFIMQIINRNNEMYFVFQRAGRTGNTGKNNVLAFTTKKGAEERFKDIFLEKTGVEWDKRNNHFDVDSSSGKYEYVELKFQNMKRVKIERPKNMINLNPRVNTFLEIIFSNDVVNESLKSANVNLKILGELSQAQIQKGYRILEKIKKSITMGDKDSLKELSNRFYAVIPQHKSVLDVIATTDAVKDKADVLNMLSDIETTMEITKYNKDTIDKYLNLGCEINLETDEFVRDMISKMVKNSHGSTHRHVKTEIIDIYNLRRPEEDKYMDKYAEKGVERQLLYHGSRLVNQVGILSKGLKIKPKGVYHTGSMFGNGVYFANCYSKSANYMRGNGKYAVMLICEVATGNPKILYNASNVKSLDGKDSVLGYGLYGPKDYKSFDGCKVPMGLCQRDKKHNLYYDEYIVYKTEQIRLRYAVLVKWKH